MISRENNAQRNNWNRRGSQFDPRELHFNLRQSSNGLAKLDESS